MYVNLSKTEKENLLNDLRVKLDGFKAQNLNLDMSRGKPAAEQLDITMDMFDVLNSKSEIKGSVDYRNYGILDGIPEFKAIYQELLNLKSSELVVMGNSSLNLMYDSVQRAMQFGIMGMTPFNKLEKVKWLCPVPGYDRHFAVTGQFGIEMINVPMTPNGPNMDIVEELIKDESVKGMWCVPKYSNPEGVVYSDEVVKRLASMKPAAKDFRIYWDNAYMVHTLEEVDTELLDILAEAKKYGNEDIVYMFGSTSKISFAGAGIAFIAGSEKNMQDIKSKLFFQTIGPDKINQFQHAMYFKNADGIKKHMQKHRAVIKPKFDAVLGVLEEEFNNTGVASWLNPKGGYFISCDLNKDTAKKTIALTKECGVIFTPAGSTYPYMNDPDDKNVRIAPTLPKPNELILAMRVFCTAAKIVFLEKLLNR